MKRTILILLCLLGLRAMAQAIPSGGATVECGTWLQLTATPREDFHFVEWSDGNTDSLRLVEVTADATYIAYFAANCAEWANWPVVALYDWLLMLNIKEINARGYYFRPEDVTWYRVVGEPDMPSDDVKDDVVVGTGYYLTLAKNLKGTGDYYAIIDVSINPSALLCTDVMRSVLIHYAGSEDSRQLSLLPNVTTIGGEIRLAGLDPTELCQIFVYSASGQFIDQFSSSGQPEYVLRAASVSGCYYVRVVSPTIDAVLKYIVLQ